VILSPLLCFASSFSSNFSKDERAKWPVALHESLSDAEKANASIEMVAHVVVTGK
jgi:hypothetical protein